MVKENGEHTTGGESADEILDCTASPWGDLFIAGETFSSTNISSPGSFQTTLSGITDCLVAKFNPEGTRIWGTYYGGSAGEWLNSCAIDDSVNLYLAGPTTSSGLATPGAYQLTLINGSQTCIVAKFDSAGQRKWATYYGGGGADHGWCDVDTSWNIYVGGLTASPTLLSTPGSYQPGFGGGTYDSFLARFTQCVIPATAGSISGPDTVCKSLSSVVFTVPVISGASGYSWHLPPGAVITAGNTTNSIEVWFGPGSNSGYLSVYGYNYCGSGDSSYVYITVINSPTLNLAGPDTLCVNTIAIYSTTNGMAQYNWSISAGGAIVSGGTNLDDTVVVDWNTPGQQWVTVNAVDVTGCAAYAPASMNVMVEEISMVEVTIVTETDTVCAGSPVTITATPVFGGLTPLFQWQVNGINTGTNDSVFSYVPVNGDQVSCILTSSESCTSNNPDTSDTIAMVVYPVLPVSITITPSTNPICEGLPVTFTGAAINGGFVPVYQWQVNGINTGSNSPIFTYNPTNNDIVTCTLTSSELCTSNNPASSIQHQLSVLETPIVTFTPCFDTITTTNAKPIRLQGGVPLGGIFSGTGVAGLGGGGGGIEYYFDPAVAGPGTHEITYNYINEAGCEDSSSIFVFNFQFSILNCGDSLTDIRDSQKYPTVLIGTQCWMAENLNFGTEILLATSQRDNCIPEKYCFNDTPVPCALRPVPCALCPVPCALCPVPCALSSALYQWDEVMTYTDSEETQGLCPPAWHVPSESDWNQLFAYYQNNAFAGAPLKSTGYSGFNAFLRGTVFFNRDWYFENFATLFWSSTSHGPYKAWAHGMNEYNYSVSFYPAFRANAFSVRCLRD